MKNNDTKSLNSENRDSLVTQSYVLRESTVRRVRELSLKTGWSQNQVADFLLSHGNIVPLVDSL